MMGLHNLTESPLSSQTFTANSSQWQIWNKPQNAKMVYIFMLGGGSGGGGGKTSAINSSPGGGGGASSAITTGIYSAHLLPDTLYLQVGVGGAGGIAQTNGGAGALSYISYQPDTTAINILMQSGAVSPTGGGGATSSTVPGAGGTAGTAWIESAAINGDLGVVLSSAGQNGASGTSTGGTIVNLTPNNIVTGGAGGGACSAGGTPYLGGSITGSSFIPTISSGTSDAADARIHGSAGYDTLLMNSLPNFFTGGAGGACATTAGRVGGKGGAATYGSGGGGGGGSYRTTGGQGGQGGDGLIIITCI